MNARIEKSSSNSENQKNFTYRPISKFPGVSAVFYHEKNMDPVMIGTSHPCNGGYKGLSVSGGEPITEKRRRAVSKKLLKKFRAAKLQADAESENAVQEALNGRR